MCTGPPTSATPSITMAAAKSVVNTMQSAASALIREFRWMNSTRPTVRIPVATAARNMGTVEISLTTRNAATNPKSTLWLIASPTIATRRSSRKFPTNPHAAAARNPVRTIPNDVSKSCVHGWTKTRCQSSGGINMFMPSLPFQASCPAGRESASRADRAARVGVVPQDGARFPRRGCVR